MGTLQLKVVKRTEQEKVPHKSMKILLTLIKAKSM